MPYGRSVLGRVGSSVIVSADGNPLYKSGAVKINWEAITAASSLIQVTPQGDQSTIDSFDLLTASGWADIVEVGEKYIRWGTVICKLVGGTYDGQYVPYGSASGLGGGVISKLRGDVFILNQSVRDAEDNPVAIEGGLLFKHRLVVNYSKVQKLDTLGATGGTFTLAYKGQVTSGQAFNVSAANLQTALEGLSTIGAGKVTVALASGVYTITLNQSLAPFGDLVLANSLTGGSGASAVLADAADTVAGPTQTEFESIFPNVRLVNELN